MAAHASSLVPMPENHPAALTVFWFSGERESGPRVQIVAAQWDRSRKAWGNPKVVANRHVLGQQLGFGVRRLGNPVAWLDAQQRMHLFVVATGWGGWAASRILHLQQRTPGNGLEALEFDPVGLMPLSWLWNTSYLVRNTPMPLQDGGVVLPAHFELGQKYPVMMRLDAAGRFLGLQRISARPYLLQPTLLSRSPRQWVALMRDERASGHVCAAVTDDGGQHWRDVPDLALPNPDAAVGGFTLAPGNFLLAHNPSSATREQLDLSASTDGLAWRRLHILERGQSGDEFSYPSLAWADNSVWVSYTVDRKRLAWQRFAPLGVVKQGQP
jgi:predicted neuraminidase